MCLIRVRVRVRASVRGGVGVRVRVRVRVRVSAPRPTRAWTGRGRGRVNDGLMVSVRVRVRCERTGHVLNVGLDEEPAGAVAALGRRGRSQRAYDGRHKRGAQHIARVVGTRR